MVKVYKVELCIIDTDNLGEEEVKLVIENTRYPNHCINPQVKNIETREIEWSDSHPLNMLATADQAYKDLFK